MVSSAPRNSFDSISGKNPAKALSVVTSRFVENAKRNKHSFIQFLAMSGILPLNFRSISQKYRVHYLEEDTAALKGERDSLTDRMKHIKSSLLPQASIDSPGVFAHRLRLLFSDDDQ